MPMRILMHAIPAYGHVLPMVPLAIALHEAGHDVTFAAGTQFTSGLGFRSIDAVAAGQHLGAVAAETAHRHPQLSGLDFTLALFADVTAELVLTQLLPQMTAEPPDLVVYEAMDVGAGAAAEVLGVPATALAIGLETSFLPVIHDAARRYQADLWHRHGRDPVQRPLLAEVLIDPAPPMLRAVAAGLAMPTRPLRSQAWSPAQQPLPSSLSHPGTGPLVYLTLGTVAFGAVQALRTAIEQSAQVAGQVLVAAGPEADLDLLRPVPDNVLVERFVDQPAALAVADAAVHHGGTGTVLGAAEAGVPQLLLPQGADQFRNAELIGKAGFGRALLADQTGDGAIAAALTDLLATGSPARTASAAVAAEIAAMPSAREVAGRLTAGR